MPRHGFSDSLNQQGVVGRHALDGGVVQTRGPWLATEFAQFAQLIDHTHDGFSVDPLA